ncbi:MAG: bifunctional ornithine acetyltransferase/N-acetylglutamate synthase [Gammaproteobacteria bacterium]|nr:MAG: bifunctional ornithine acetyltransferase/N-acetylglutamate synthase [Gammaproteobacteria bacterium]
MPLPLTLAPAIPVPGVHLTTLAAGIKASGSDDMVVITLPEGTVTAGVFTKNGFCAAPVTVAREHLESSSGGTRVLLINSGNANAGTGEPGRLMARGHCKALASALGVATETVLPFSTGVIGQLLPDERMLAGIEKAASVLRDKAEEPLAPLADWEAAARGIMTTDTQVKLTSRELVCAGQRITITGMAKGAGMIQPNMATMLSYVFTDATIDMPDLDAALHEAVARSFNAITVDSDTSTNDACLLSATGASGVSLSRGDDNWQKFQSTLDAVCLDLAQAVIRDAEGASKFVTVVVEGGRDDAEAREVAYAIANSPLVKTAMFASDANLGRLLMAIGKTELPDFDSNVVRVRIGDVPAFEKGGIVAGYSEERASAVMAETDIEIGVQLGRGEAETRVYTSDLSHEYVTVNAEYRT